MVPPTLLPRAWGHSPTNQTPEPQLPQTFAAHALVKQLCKGLAPGSWGEGQSTATLTHRPSAGTAQRPSTHTHYQAHLCTEEQHTCSCAIKCACMGWHGAHTHTGVQRRVPNAGYAQSNMHA